MIDNTEFLKLFKLNQLKFYGFAFKLTKNQEDANDLIQETCYKALKNIKQFKQGSNFQAWMITIMRNNFVNGFRQQKNKRNAMEYIEDNPNNFESAVNNKGASNQLIVELKAIINELSEDLKRPFLLNFIGFQYEEIATKLEIPLGTVKSKIFYARKHLKTKIRNRYNINHFSEIIDD